MKASTEISKFDTWNTIEYISSKTPIEATIECENEKGERKTIEISTVPMKIPKGAKRIIFTEVSHKKK